MNKETNEATITELKSFNSEFGNYLMKQILKEIEEGTLEQPQGILKVSVDKLTSIFKPWLDQFLCYGS